MYDNFKIEPKYLPISAQDKANLKGEFQTKCLERMLYNYEVIDNHLFVTERSLDKNPLTVKLDFTGVVNFYDYNIHKDWLEFEASFVGGKLIMVNLILLERVE